MRGSNARIENGSHALPAQVLKPIATAAPARTTTAFLEGAVVGDPAANARVVHLRQLSQRFVAAVMQRSVAYLAADAHQHLYDWVLDLAIKGFFDSIDWELLPKAVRHHTDCPWVLLYVERWLKVPVQREDGSVVPRTSGTPQGGVVSPVLANLFLHYSFDMWMNRTYPQIPFA